MAALACQAIVMWLHMGFTLASIRWPPSSSAQTNTRHSNANGFHPVSSCRRLPMPSPGQQDVLQLQLLLLLPKTRPQPILSQPWPQATTIKTAGSQQARCDSHSVWRDTADLKASSIDWRCPFQSGLVCRCWSTAVPLLLDIVGDTASWHHRNKLCRSKHPPNFLVYQSVQDGPLTLQSFVRAALSVLPTLPSFCVSVLCHAAWPLPFPQGVTCRGSCAQKFSISNYSSIFQAPGFRHVLKSPQLLVPPMCKPRQYQVYMHHTKLKPFFHVIFSLL